MAEEGMDPEIEGAEAYYQGRGLDANPYTGDDSDKWEFGWYDARDEVRCS